ncbi:MAG: hypothetical protein HRT88_10245 [Lentisphaeraceae bacterium]|nr:hypothetical protein [Lentisphaeraceae bacterium]
MHTIPMGSIEQQKLFIDVSQKLEEAQLEIERLKDKLSAKTGPITFDSQEQRNRYVKSASAQGFKMGQYAIHLFEKDWKENDELKKVRKEWDKKTLEKKMGND